MIHRLRKLLTSFLKGKRRSEKVVGLRVEGVGREIKLYSLEPSTWNLQTNTKHLQPSPKFSFSVDYKIIL